MFLSVYQKDTAFKFSNIGPDNDQFVDYTCFLIGAQEYINNKNVEKATTLTNCGNTATLTKVDATNPIDTGFETRTHTTTISFTPTDATYGCGGFQDGNNQAVFAVTCKRYEAYDKAFDYTFVAFYDANKEACTALQLDPVNFDVADPPTVNHKREFEVTFKAYTNSDLVSVPWPDGPQSTDGAHGGIIQEVTTAAIPLGTAIYFEICLMNPSTPPDFYPDGVGFIGVYVKKCTARNDATAGTEGINPDTPVTFIDNGCALGVEPTEYLAKAGSSNGRGFMYVKDTTDATMDWLRTPNCFRWVVL
ncbi:uncharacterized protein LOC123541078 isoform X2 [Mercenaria mercenaria]|nr:uncharacterized protein LOC123541078 isoform X2 [Mercenaria mercenaria]